MYITATSERFKTYCDNSNGLTSSVLVLLSSYCLLFPHLCHMQILLLSRHDLVKSREQWLWQTTVKINISVFLLLNAVGMYLNTGHSMMYKAYAIKMSSLITSMKTI